MNRVIRTEKTKKDIAEFGIDDQNSKRGEKQKIKTKTSNIETILKVRETYGAASMPEANSDWREKDGYEYFTEDFAGACH